MCKRTSNNTLKDYAVQYARATDKCIEIYKQIDKLKQELEVYKEIQQYTYENMVRDSQYNDLNESIIKEYLNNLKEGYNSIIVDYDILDAINKKY